MPESCPAHPHVRRELRDAATGERTCPACATGAAPLTAPPLPARESDAAFLSRMGMDARRWAEEFGKRFPSVSVDDVLGWFANAIMVGFDEGQRRPAPCAHAGARLPYRPHLGMEFCAACGLTVPVRKP